jgi:hypothetical protein
MEEAIVNHAIGNVSIKAIRKIIPIDEIIRSKIENLSIDISNDVVVKNVEKKDIGF